jgi:predicted adenylyl cyclase CyaB
LGRNIEIKAHARNFQKQKQIAQSLSDVEAEIQHQEDTFFKVAAGRLKLRLFANGSGVLIQYRRKDALGPTESHYQLVHTDDPAGLKQALTNALGAWAVVKKERMINIADQTRIHLDRVEGLGDFIELEVVLERNEPLSHGIAIAEEFMRKLEIQEDDLIETAYADLISDRRQAGEDR